MHREEIVRYLDGLLDASRFRDYCPNGLQVEGRAEVRLVISGVTANLALIDAAIAAQADAILVHHGYFWRGEDPRVVGMRRERLAKLLGHGINLFAYHLPLDAHPQLGNNAQLGRLLGIAGTEQAGEQGLICIGRPSQTTLGEFSAHVAAQLGRTPLVIGDAQRSLRRVAWCTGGAQGLFEEALALNVDAYLTGEISEQHVHIARESGVAFMACGHHATERLGVQALGERLGLEYGVEHRFVDVPSPV